MQRIQVQAEKRKTAIFILPPKSACSINELVIRTLDADPVHFEERKHHINADPLTTNAWFEISTYPSRAPFSSLLG